MPAKPNILVAPLDWGLGHATRCIPLIAQLLQQGCKVWLAADGPQATVLHEAFPNLPMLQLPGYEVRYSSKAVWWKILSQVPAIVRSVSKEHQWLQQIVKQHQIDLVISDNRYGLWSLHCKSILMTHQLAPAMPPSMLWAKGILRSMLYQQLSHFTECWVPDEANPSASLSGALGHPSILPKVPVHYMGWLTRFENDSTILKTTESSILILLSGPEPQRTLLEEMLLKQLPSVQQQVLLVRGLPNEKSIPVVAPHVQVQNHLPAKDLQTAMQQSSYVISRGGYSTLMDAFTLQKKCIFIPTPGQTEQEYLCKKLQQQQGALCFAQSEFQLTRALQQAETFSFQLPAPPDTNVLSAFVEAALHRLQQ